MHLVNVHITYLLSIYKIYLHIHILLEVLRDSRYATDAAMTWIGLNCQQCNKRLFRTFYWYYILYLFTYEPCSLLYQNCHRNKVNLYQVSLTITSHKYKCIYLHGYLYRIKWFPLVLYFCFNATARRKISSIEMCTHSNDFYKYLLLIT